MLRWFAVKVREISSNFSNLAFAFLSWINENFQYFIGMKWAKINFKCLNDVNNGYCTFYSIAK